MSALYGAADGVNRKFRELWANDETGVNRKLKELWASDGTGVNRKIFSGADCQAHNYFSSGFNADGSISLILDADLLPAKVYVPIMSLHFNAPVVYTDYFNVIFYNFSRFCVNPYTTISYRIRITNAGGSTLYDQDEITNPAVASKKYGTPLNGSSNGSSTDFYFSIWKVGSNSELAFHLTASSFVWCGKTIQNIDLI